MSLATTREDLLRALLEGICGEIGRSLRTLEQSCPIDTVCLSGGLSGTDAVCQLLADMTGITVCRPDGGDATTRGAWMSAACCLKLVPGWNGAWEKAGGGIRKRFEPDAPLTAYYHEWLEQIEGLGRGVEDICWKD